MKIRPQTTRARITTCGTVSILFLLVISLYAGTDVSWHNITNNPSLSIDPYSRTPDEAPPKSWTEKRMGPDVEDWEALVPFVDVDYPLYRKLKNERRQRTLKGDEWVQYHVGKTKFASRRNSNHKKPKEQEPKLESVDIQVAAKRSF